MKKLQTILITPALMTATAATEFLGGTISHFAVKVIEGNPHAFKATGRGALIYTSGKKSYYVYNDFAQISYGAEFVSDDIQSYTFVYDEKNSHGVS